MRTNRFVISDTFFNVLMSVSSIIRKPECQQDSQNSSITTHVTVDVLSSLLCYLCSISQLFNGHDTILCESQNYLVN